MLIVGRKLIPLTQKRLPNYCPQLTRDPDRLSCSSNWLNHAPKRHQSNGIASNRDGNTSHLDPVSQSGPQMSKDDGDSEDRDPTKDELREETDRRGILEVQNTAEDLIYKNFQDGDGNIRLNEFKSALAITGLDYSRDIRLKEFRTTLKSLGRQDGLLSKDEFKSIIKPNIVLISRAMRGDFVIPDWTKFTNKLEEFYWKCKVNKGGKVADYIPQLAKYNPDYWGISMCTIDGQRFQFGDVDVPFTIQSSGKPINYAIALNELGSDETHRYVGQEPSGRLFNDLSLKIFEDGDRPKPHNPMVNSGAIVICSLLMSLIQKSMKTSEKFDWVCDIYKSMAHGEHVGFNNATFLSEREAADRNYAIGFYMRENKCFPEDTNLKTVMDFYFQLCSLEVNCLTVSMMAATLANGGICPMTEERIFDSRAVRDVLSLMHSCGMYDYSGQFAFNVGLPAKSGVSGCTMVVIPNIGGLGLFSPPLDSYGNSVRSLQFCNELVNHFNFHQYDNLRHVPHKSDPRRKRYETLGLNIICLLFAAAKGDMSAIRRYYMSGMDMSLSDYDHRTALHSAAAEGHLQVIEFLLETCGLQHELRDRWGRRPVDDANYGGHKHVADFLTRWPEIKQQLQLRHQNIIKSISTHIPSPNMSQRVIVYGGRGALGSAAVSAFKKLKWWVLAIDLESNGPHPEADNRILIKSQHVASLVDQERQVLEEAQEALEGNKVDAIICVAGGWAGGNATSEDLVKNTDMMLKQSVWPSIISTRLAGLHLSEDGLVVLTGAKPALEGTPNMIGYGLAKAATHQLAKSLAAKGSGLPSTSATLAILPITLDTPMNRKWMPNANYSEWTPLEFVTSLFEKWIRNQERPKSGSLVIIDGQETIVGD